MNRTILLAVDAARHSRPGAATRHVAAAAKETLELSRETGDRVLVLHVHEFAHGRFGRLQVDCAEGEGEKVVEQIVSDLKAAGVTADAEIRTADLGHIARTILAAARDCDARIVVLARAAVPTRRTSRSAACPPGCCTWPGVRFSSCPGTKLALARGSRRLRMARWAR
jgi:hypothetical protein